VAAFSQLAAGTKSVAYLSAYTHLQLQNTLSDGSSRLKSSKNLFCPIISIIADLSTDGRKTIRPANNLCRTSPWDSGCLGSSKRPQGCFVSTLKSGTNSRSAVIKTLCLV
jgi:hypothetical protein